jgi:two-component system cell cycle sensor histidine kinase PleC
MESGSKPALTAAQMRASTLALAQLGQALGRLSSDSRLRPLLALALCLMFAHWVDTFRLALWYALVLAGALTLIGATVFFKRRDPPPQKARAWIFACTGAYLLFALSWSTMGYFLWAPNNDLNHAAIILLLACAMGGDGALAAASTPLSLTTFGCYGAALILTPQLQGGSLRTILLLLTLPFLAYVAFVMRQAHRTTRNMLGLRQDKDNLIAELARAKTQAESAREQAQTANLAKAHFLANMGHELRTPLNAILGFSEMIFTRTFTNPEKHYEYAELIHGSGQTLLALINDILDLAKLETGRLQLRESIIDLAAVIDEEIHKMQPKADAADCALTMEVAENLPPVFADERAIRQVLGNLLANAVKFSAKGCAMAFAFCASDGSVHFGVADTGIGIAAADQAHLFEHFGHGRSDIVKGAKGAGLGLPIVHGLVTLHGGHVMLDSTEGEGTRVTAILPAARVRARPAFQAAS